LECGSLAAAFLSGKIFPRSELRPSSTSETVQSKPLKINELQMPNLQVPCFDILANCPGVVGLPFSGSLISVLWSPC
jgi:hypothetical protein